MIILKVLGALFFGVTSIGAILAIGLLLILGWTYLLGLFTDSEYTSGEIDFKEHCKIYFHDYDVEEIMFHMLLAFIYFSIIILFGFMVMEMLFSK